MNHTVTINLGNKNVKSFAVPADMWRDVVEEAARLSEELGVMAHITITSERRGVIFEGAAVGGKWSEFAA